MFEIVLIGDGRPSFEKIGHRLNEILPRATAYGMRFLIPHVV
jgi:hypothetical protein